MERIIRFTMEADNPSKKCSWFFVYRQFSFFLNTSYYKKNQSQTKKSKKRNMDTGFSRSLSSFQWTVSNRLNIEKSQLIAEAAPLICAGISYYHYKPVVFRKIFVFCLPSRESLNNYHFSVDLQVLLAEQ